MILTVAELREHVESPLGDPALQRLLNDAEAAIVQRAGASGSRTQLAAGGYRFITLHRPAASITSISEDDWPNGTVPLVLAADDYVLHPGGYVLERASGGTNSRSTWNRRVSVVYTPVDDAAVRIGVQIDLIQLALSYAPGLSAQTIGTWSEQYANNSAWNNSEEREAILHRLDGEPMMLVVGGAG